MLDTQLFTEIVSLPIGIDADNLYRITANGTDLGLFAGGTNVDFVALLGFGVPLFVITEITPEVDGEDPLAFPIQIEFDAPRASFVMTPLPEPRGTLLLMGPVLLLCQFAQRRRILSLTTKQALVPSSLASRRSGCAKLAAK